MFCQCKLYSTFLLKLWELWKLANTTMYLLQGSWLLALEIQRRCFHVSPLAAAASKVAMSKFDKDTLPYDKLQKNLEIVKKRYFYEVNRWRVLQ